MNIRLGEAEDIEEVARLWLLMAAELSPEKEPRLDWWISLTTGLLESGMYGMFVATSGDAIVGFADYVLSPEPVDGKIHMVGRHIYILPEYRFYKVAHLLYKNVIEDATRKGATIFDIYCEDLSKSIWTKHGYTKKSYILSREV